MLLQVLNVSVTEQMGRSCGFRSVEARRYSMHFHLLTLRTFEPHPRAQNAVLSWPIALTRKKVSLCFQICDDGMFVMHHHTPGGPQDLVVGWQWTTGRLAVVSHLLYLR